MKSSTFIKQEYFKLVKKINQANKLKNQETDVYFCIDSTETDNLKLYAAVSSSRKILLCRKSYGTVWIEAGFSAFPNLEHFIVELLNSKNKHDNLTSLIKSHIFKFKN